MNTSPTEIHDNSPEPAGPRYPRDGGTFGRYNQLRIIGRGGMGRVYQAWDTKLERWVALKTIHPEMLAKPRLLERFSREVRMHARLTIPGVVRVYDGGHEGDWPYYTMEFIEGRPLTAVLGDDTVTLPARQALFGQLAFILSKLHEQRVCHRDLKPANILLRADGQPMLVDFGIAKQLGPEAAPGMTMEGLRPGTVRYLSPDRPVELEREPRAVMAADVYALGLVGYELLTYGKFPYELREEDYTDAVQDIRTKAPVPPRQWNDALDPVLADLLLAVLAKEWRERPTAAELAERLGVSSPLVLGGAAARVVIAAANTVAEEAATMLLPKRPASRARAGSAATRLSSDGVVDPAPAAKAKAPVAPAMPGPAAPPAATIAPAAIAAPPAPAPARVPTGLPRDLLPSKDAAYAPLKGLGAGSQAALDQQRAVVQQLGWPLEVKTAKVGLILRLLPPGSFTMGSPLSEERRNSDERPHRVSLTQPFLCGRYPVTQAQWQAVMGRNPATCESEWKNAPVEGVSWADCQEFLAKLCLAEKVPADTYTLLTEAQWEYACRAGSTTVFAYGDSLDSTQANFNGNNPYGAGRVNDYRATTTPVGQFAANAFGLHDGHGNVWEWCQDWYGDYPAEASADAALSDPLGAPSGQRRIIRGGAWSVYAWYCRSAYRGKELPITRNRYLGLRVARRVE